MTEYIHNVSLNTVNELLDVAVAGDIAVEAYEGVLNDTNVIYADNNMTVGSREPYRYIVCYYKFASAWQNTLHIMLTNDFSEVLERIGNDECIRCGGVYNMFDMSMSDGIDGYICGDCNV